MAFWGTAITIRMQYTFANALGQTLRLCSAAASNDDVRVLRVPRQRQQAWSGIVYKKQE